MLIMTKKHKTFFFKHKFVILVQFGIFPLEFSNRSRIRNNPFKLTPVPSRCHCFLRGTRIVICCSHITTNLGGNYDAILTFLRFVIHLECFTLNTSTSSLLFHHRTCRFILVVFTRRK